MSFTSGSRAKGWWTEASLHCSKIAFCRGNIVVPCTINHGGALALGSAPDPHYSSRPSLMGAIVKAKAVPRHGAPGTDAGGGRAL